MEREFTDLLLNHTNDYNKARLLAVSAKYSKDWRNALPIRSCGLRLDDEAVRVAVSLRLAVDSLSANVTHASVEPQLT